ncbi:Placenta-expressed transcript 1 protein [Apodemus speciosus]|uniref:Placenta-expressed transcript 1 protein n=1 Tax=Apodemus speciosus TaxID=105296 RepID=A0ABQ0F507_APOSI
MPALRSLLPHLGLLLCLALCLSPSLSASDNESCVVFDASYPSNNLGINITAKEEVSGGNVSYAVTVPVNNSVSAVIVKAVKEDGSLVGTWGGAHQKCNGSSVYNLTSPSNLDVFQTNWTVPDSEDMTKVDLQVFIVVNRTALVSSLKVDQEIPMTVKSLILTPPPESFETSQTITTTTTTTAVNTAKMTAMNTAKTTAMNTAKTTAVNTAKTTAVSPAKTTARSLAVHTFGSPLAGALHILLVFLISKLLF